MKEITIGYGAIQPPIYDQLVKQGVEYARPGDAKAFQAHADAITRLYLNGILTDGETDKARKRLQKRIAMAIKEIA